MAHVLTHVDGVAGAAGQGFSAGLPAGGDGVHAAAPLRVAQLQQLGQGRLAAGAAAHQPGQPGAGWARPGVAGLLAAVVPAVQLLSAELLTGEVPGPVEVIPICSARNLPRLHPAVTHLLGEQRAGLALGAMADLGAAVLPAVERGAAHRAATDGGRLAAAHRLVCFPADAGFVDKGGTLRTRSRVTQDVAGVVAVSSAPLLPAHLPTAVRDLAAPPLRVRHLPTEAHVGVGGPRGNVLTGRTPPSFSPILCLRGRGAGPLLDAVEVENVEAAQAAPDRGHDPDDITAHHALVLLLRQLLDQAACLCLFALGHLHLLALTPPSVQIWRPSLPPVLLHWCLPPLAPPTPPAGLLPPTEACRVTGGGESRPLGRGF